MIPHYNPEFYDGWQPPQPVSPAANQGLSRSNSQHIPPRKEMMQQMPDEVTIITSNKMPYGFQSFVKAVKVPNPHLLKQ